MTDANVHAQLAVLEEVVARLLAEYGITTGHRLDDMHQALVHSLTETLEAAPESDARNRAEAALHAAADRLFVIAKAWQAP